MKSKFNDKNIERLLKGASTVIISTDNGIGIEGNLPMILSNLAMIVHQISNNGCPKNLIEHAVKLGLGEEEKENKSKKGNDSFEETIKDVLRSVRDDLDKMIGDDNNE